jgi:allantoicase
VSVDVSRFIDLASERFGAVVITANDDFFAPKENLIKPSAPQWIEGKYTDRGKWMDGWETRRRRDPSTGSAPGAGTHDWCVVKLGARGIVRAVDVETTHFKGNYPEACSIEAGDGEHWLEILPASRLKGDTHNLFDIDIALEATYLRLRIYPDGGVARLRAYGRVAPDWTRLKQRPELDLAAAEHGGFVVSCSDMFFGSRNNLIMPGDATHMGDGWETKRRRGPGHDWSIIRLAAPGTIHRVEVDTRHFKGNAPGACDLEAACVSPEADEQIDAVAWQPLVDRVPLTPHAVHVLEREVRAVGAMTRVRFNIYPDGGVGRLRLFGVPR